MSRNMNPAPTLAGIPSLKQDLLQVVDCVAVKEVEVLIQPDAAF